MSTKYFKDRRHLIKDLKNQVELSINIKKKPIIVEKK